MIHLDIKPDNILYDPSSETYYLCDLGMAQEFTAQRPEAPADIKWSSSQALQGSPLSSFADHESLAYTALALDGVDLPWFTESNPYQVQPYLYLSPLLIL